MGVSDVAESPAKKTVLVNPLKVSPAMGASFALQSIKGAFPLIHAAPGCTFLAKVLMTSHLNEPIAMGGTDIQEMDTILGASDLLEEKIQEALNQEGVEMVAVISTALSEVRGEDVKGTVNVFRDKGLPVYFIEAPDFAGGFSEGYAAAIESIVEHIPVREHHENAEMGTVNLIPAPHHTAADVEEIKRYIETFGLKVITLPDSSISINGARDKYGKLPLTGTSLDDIARMGSSFATISFGLQMKHAGDLLGERSGVPHFNLASVTGMKATDEFIELLMKLSGAPVPEFIRRGRNILKDALVDAHLHVMNQDAAVALELGHYLDLKEFLHETGLRVTEIIVPHRKKELAKLDKDARKGDLGDLELALRNKKALILSNSHAAMAAHHTGNTLIRMGFPVFDRLGSEMVSRVGYTDSARFVFEIVNALLGAH